MVCIHHDDKWCNVHKGKHFIKFSFMGNYYTFMKESDSREKKSERVSMWRIKGEGFLSLFLSSFLFTKKFLFHHVNMTYKHEKKRLWRRRKKIYKHTNIVKSYTQFTKLSVYINKILYKATNIWFIHILYVM